MKVSEVLELKTYLRHSIQNVVDVKDLTALEYLDFEGKYRDYSELHDFWELCYVENGELTLSLDEKSLVLVGGTLFLIPPNRKHSYTASPSGENRAFVACFESSSQSLKSLAEIPILAGEVERASINSVIEESQSTFYMNENEHLEALPSANFGGQQAILLQLEYLLIRLLRRLSSDKNAEVVFLDGKQFYSDLAEVLMRHFRDNLGARLSLSDVADKFNYSRSFLCKTFKEQTGESIMSCFMRLKVEEAERLLRETDKTVSEVAATLGFSDAKYFGALFKSHTGASPTEFRNNKRIK